MVTDTVLDTALFAPADAPAQPDLLVCATLHLMSHYTTGGGCVKLASVIERHLKALADAPGLAPMLRATCRQLSEQWESVVERTLPQPEKFRLFGKFMSGPRCA